MNGPEIRERIISLNEELEQNIAPAFFTLNKKVEAIRDEIDTLQRQCPHEYDDAGFCIFCDKRKI